MKGVGRQGRGGGGAGPEEQEACARFYGMRVVPVLWLRLWYEGCGETRGVEGQRGERQRADAWKG